jgi:hypothetical protein
MDKAIKESLESLLSEHQPTKRLGRRIVNLAGFLSPHEVPTSIQEQLATLSRLLIQQDAFDALLEPVQGLARATQFPSLEPGVLGGMLESLEEARKAVCASADVNYPLLISWLVGLAEERKIIRIKRDAAR